MSDEPVLSKGTPTEGAGGGAPAKLGHAKVDTHEHLHAERTLIYPKALITMTLDIPRIKSVYIIVKTKVLDDVLLLARTDSVEGSELEPIKFKSKIGLTYYVG
jgi:hypothetical protein